MPAPVRPIVRDNPLGIGEFPASGGYDYPNAKMLKDIMDYLEEVAAYLDLSVMAYTDTQIIVAKAYADTQDNGVRAYTDAGVASAKAYADTQDALVRIFANKAANAVNNSPADFVLSNSTTPTDVYTEAVAGGFLGTTGRMRRVLLGRISTDGTTPGSITIEVSYGGTSLTVLGAVGLDAGMTDEPFELTIDLSAKNSVGAQMLAVKLSQDGVPPVLVRRLTALASGSTFNLVARVTWSVANANNVFRLECGG